MYYVLFTYSKGIRERSFRGFRSQEDVIDFVHKNYEKIDIVQIIAAEKSFRLGLIETEELIKSELIAQEIEPDLPDPKKKSFMEEIIDETEEKEALKIPDEAILEPGEKSAMEKIGDDIETEMTEEEIIKKNKERLNRADKAIAAAKKDLAKRDTKLIINPAEKPAKKSHSEKYYDKTDWPICPDCKKNKMAPWNESGRCSECQQYKKIPKKLKFDKTEKEK